LGGVSAPRPLNGYFDLSLFDCGNDGLNAWLKKYALKNQETGSSRTFVVTSKKRVVGYYALATGSVERRLSPSMISRNSPNPIPVMVLGRLAVDISMQSKGIGSGLLKDAVLRVYRVSHDVGFKALLVHAISPQAKDFYLQYGFAESPLESMTLMLPISDISALLDTG